MAGDATMARGQPKAAARKRTGHGGAIVLKKSLSKQIRRGHGKARKSVNPNRIPLGNRATGQKQQMANDAELPSSVVLSELTSSQQIDFFVKQYQSARRIVLSSLELSEFRETCFIELSQDIRPDPGNLSMHLKNIFGVSWKEVLCKGQLLEENFAPGNPAVIVICLSAVRTLELIRGLRPLTRECKAAKLFAKHLKIDDQIMQVVFLRSHVNIACGTPNRIRKLIEMDALGLSRLQVIVLDIQTDAKGYCLFSLPQVSAEFWNLYSCHFHQRLLKGNLRICLWQGE